MSGRIPARIVSAWFGPAPEPEAFAAERARWRALMPGWSFLHATFPNVAMPLTATLARDGFPPVVLSDLARMELIHSFGGIWLDLDVTLLKPLDPLRAGPFVTFEHPDSGHAGERRIASGVFGAPAGLSVLADLARVADARARQMTCSPVIACGPELWTMFRCDLEQAGFRTLPHPAFHPTDGWPRAAAPTAAEFPESYGVHQFAGTWR